MNKLILLSLVCTGFAATAMPFPANAATQRLDSHGDSTLTLAQYRRNDRQFNVYYRGRGNRSWILENSYANRRQAVQASRRLERRGYNTYVQLSREVGRR
ncbi:hypothetical protein [Chamaesiphon sp. OTE_8_metabat_110]|uniref:hypothetical protein n=1 Tax=Chamaesiphon sp. OTE_8_metabat_110 TaxID=2964696 RepID=UPI00286B049C|nr:hypothetical protein [Chamaesiphon sp. OTE_8_metabat_110]